MANGCILGDCWVCEELIWEDEEWELVNGEFVQFVHKECADKAVTARKEIQKLKKEVERLKEKVENLEDKLLRQKEE